MFSMIIDIKTMYNRDIITTIFTTNIYLAFSNCAFTIRYMDTNMIAFRDKVGLSIFVKSSVVPI